jgi:NADH-quinone oxidoreductase subunit L
MILTFTGTKRWDDEAHPHESPILMWLPMAMLAIGSVISGYLFTRGDALVHWLEPVVAPHKHGNHNELLPPIVVSGLALTIVLVGISIAVMMYVRRPVENVAPENVSILTRFVRRDLLQDAANEAIFMRPGQVLTKTLIAIDEKVIDGAVRGAGAIAIGSGSELRKSQTGYVRSYSALILVGATAIVLGIWVITK